MRQSKAAVPVKGSARLVGEGIFEQRQKMGWTQKDVANHSGLSLGFICDVENGKRRLSAENLHTIARMFGVSMDWFFDRPID